MLHILTENRLLTLILVSVDQKNFTHNLKLSHHVRCILSNWKCQILRLFYWPSMCVCQHCFNMQQAHLFWCLIVKVQEVNSPTTRWQFRWFMGWWTIRIRVCWCGAVHSSPGRTWWKESKLDMVWKERGKKEKWNVAQYEITKHCLFDCFFVCLFCGWTKSSARAMNTEV